MKKKTIVTALGFSLMFSCAKPFEVEGEFGVVVEKPGVTASPASLETSEAGNVGIFTVKLRTQPTADVTLTLQSSNVAEGRLRSLGGQCDATNGIPVTTTCTLVFTPANWSQPQAVAVVGQDDLVTDGNALYTIFFPVAAASADAKYNGLSTPAILITNTDNDLPSVSVTPLSGTTAEASGNFTFNVVLQAQPSANVSISVASSNEAEGRVRRTGGVCNTGGAVGTGTCNLTFTAANWNIAQAVTVTGIDDLVADGNKSYTIILSPAVSADASYNGFDPADIAMTSTDNGAPGFTFSATAGLVTTEAGGTASFTVRLNTVPTANVSLGLSSGNTAEGTVSPSNLTFTPANWNNTQTVTVTGVADNRIDGNIGYTIITAAATSADTAYSGLNPADISVTNNNSDAGKYLFVTNSTATGSALGAFAADNICNADGAKPRAGNYRAVIGDASAPTFSDPGPPVVYDQTIERDLFNAWVMYGNTKYYRGADGALVGQTDATGALPAVLVNSTHTSSLQYWTGLSATWGLSTGCTSTSVYPGSLGPYWATSSSARLGRYGEGSATNSGSVSQSTLACNSALRLLCAEQ